MPPARWRGEASCRQRKLSIKGAPVSNFRGREHRLSAPKNRSFSMSPSMSFVRNPGAALALVPFLLMLGCKDASKEKPPAAAVTEDPAAVHPELWPSPKWPFEKDAALEEKIATLLAKMTVEEKVGQVIQGDIASIEPAIAPWMTSPTFSL